MPRPTPYLLAAAVVLAAGGVVAFEQDAQYHGGNCFDMCTASEIASMHAFLRVLGGALAVAGLVVAALALRRAGPSRSLARLVGSACLVVGLVGGFVTLPLWFLDVQTWPEALLLVAAGSLSLLGARER